MINIKHLLKVASVWISIVYVVCYSGVAIYPPIRELTMRYAFHADMTFQSNFFGFGYFVSGLIVWNLVTTASVWLFAYLFNNIKK